MSLTKSEEKKAKELFEEFRNLYPTKKNPTDINSIEKATFLVMKGFEKHPTNAKS